MRYPHLRIARTRHVKVSEEETQSQFFKLFDLLGVDENLAEVAEPKGAPKPERDQIEQ